VVGGDFVIKFGLRSGRAHLCQGWGREFKSRFPLCDFNGLHGKA
jgi:hypothetical protein